MRTAPFGTTGSSISRLGMGGWQAGGTGPWGAGPRADDELAIAAIRRAVEGGVTWVDTAASYGLGHSEEVVRRALEPWQVGDEVLVFTKCGHPWDPPDRIRTELSPGSIRWECEGSLRRLGVERIDLYQFHHSDARLPIEESWATMDELVREGKVRWAGVSNFDVDLLERCEALRHVDAVQPELSLLSQEARAEVIPWAHRRGSAVIAYSPLASGVLAGGYDGERLAAFPEGDWRHDQAERIAGFLERLRAVGSRVGVDTICLALGWALAVEGVTGAICGARRPDQVDAWVPAADLEIDPSVLAEVEDEAAAAGFVSPEAGSQAPGH